MITVFDIKKAPVGSLQNQMKVIAKQNGLQLNKLREYKIVLKILTKSVKYN